MKFFLLPLFFYCQITLGEFLPAKFSANFVEVKKGMLSKKVIKTPGSLDYQFPGRIRLNMQQEGSPITFVSNQTTSWYYTGPFIPGEKGQLVIKKAYKPLHARIFDHLKGGLRSNPLYKVLPQKDSYLIRFSEKAKKEFQLNGLELRFRAAKPKSLLELREMVLLYPNEKKVFLVFKKIDRRGKFQKNHFEFEAPPNTQVMIQ